MGPWRETYVTGTRTLIFCSEILNDWEFWGAKKINYFRFFYIYVRNDKQNGCYFLKKSVFLKNFSVPEPFPQVSLQGPNVLLGGSSYPLKKNWKMHQKSAISSGAPILVAADGTGKRLPTFFEFLKKSKKWSF